MKIKAVIFDAFGTLFNLDNSILNDIVHPSVPDILNYTREKQLSYTWLHSLMNDYRSFDEITTMALSDGCKRFGASPELVQKLSRLYFAPVVFDDVIPGLQLLHKQSNVLLGILSNGTEEMLNSGIQLNQLEAFLDKVYSVDRVKVFKPDPRVYKMVTDDLRCAPAEVLFVSSNQWDVAGSARFGFQVCWLNRGDLFRESIIDHSDIKEILSLQEVAQHL